MEMILETKRLYLRKMVPSDFDALKKVISDPINMKYYPKPYDDDGVNRWINWCISSYEKYGFGLWAVIYKETDEMIGDCGISMQPIDNDWKPEIGYHLRRDYHQQGLGKEMTQAVKDYFFLNYDFDEVYSYMNVDNIPSYKTAEANGMTFRNFFKHGEENCRVYSITRDEWNKNRLFLTGDEMWQKSGLNGYYEAWSFGDAPDKLADLVLKGIKTATCSAYELYETEGERIPEVGDYSVILDSVGRALCIIKTTKVYVAKYSEATEEHAYKEGEGDRSLSYWRKVHKEFFINELGIKADEFDEKMLVVYEEFEVVYR